jgi:plasmid stabilization system protein ParE
MPSFRFLPLARDDLHAIWEYIAQDNLNAAENLVERIGVFCPTPQYAVHRIFGGLGEKPQNASIIRRYKNRSESALLAGIVPCSPQGGELR